MKRYILFLFLLLFFLTLPSFDIFFEVNALMMPDYCVYPMFIEIYLRGKIFILKWEI